MIVYEYDVKKYVLLGYIFNLFEICWQRKETPYPQFAEGYIKCKIGDYSFALPSEKSYTNVFDYIRNTTEKEIIETVTKEIMSKTDKKEDKQETFQADLNIYGMYYYYYLKDNLIFKVEAKHIWDALKQVIFKKDKLSYDWDIPGILPYKCFKKDTDRKTIHKWIEESYLISIKDLKRIDELEVKMGNGE